jgi:hypothetical protein
MAAIRPIDLPAAVSVEASAALIIDTGTGVEKATPAQVVDGGAPVASQAEAEVGVENTRRMTALRVKQAMDANLATTAALASTDIGKGVDLLGTVVSSSIPNPVVLRTILTDAQVSRMLAGAGDGDTDTAAVTAETAKFQAIVDQGRSFSLPEPADTYRVNQINVHLGQTIEGAGQFSGDALSAGGKFQFTGNGVDPVFAIGDGSGNPRHITLRDLSVTNVGAKAVYADNAPNLIVERCRLRGAYGLDARFSYRMAVRDSFITGTTGAIRALNNCNGLTIENVTASGGTGGRAIQVGQSQGIRIVSNIVESSLHGIWISATNDTGEGQCNGVVVQGNYVEQCSTPFIFGKQFRVIGLDCSGNYIGNNNTSVIAAREAAIQFGRIVGGRIHNNSIWLLNGGEDVFWIWLEDATGGFSALSVRGNSLTNTPANVWLPKGTYAANASVLAAVGGQCNFQFMGSGDPLGSDDVIEWISPMIDSSATVGPKTWLPDARIQMGGRIASAEVIDCDSGVLTGVVLQVGTSATAGQNVSVADMSALSFTNGRAALTMTSALFDGADRTYRVVTAVGATGKFRIRIRYRAN